MSEQCTRPGTSTKYYDNVVLSEKWWMLNSTTWLHRAGEHQYCQVIPHSIWLPDDMHAIKSASGYNQALITTVTLWTGTSTKPESPQRVQKNQTVHRRFEKNKQNEEFSKHRTQSAGVSSEQTRGIFWSALKSLIIVQFCVAEARLGNMECCKSHIRYGLLTDAKSHTNHLSETNQIFLNLKPSSKRLFKIAVSVSAANLHKLYTFRDYGAD